MKSLLSLTWFIVIPLICGFQSGLIQSAAARRSQIPTLSKLCSFENVCFLSSSLSSSKARVPSTRLFSSPQEEETIRELLEGVEFDGETPEIIRLDPNAEDIEGSIFEDIESGQPSEMMVLADLLGINGFTYILAGLIALFLSLNFFLGPGWLGQALGMQGVGSFEEVSPSLPSSVDLSRPEFRLDL